MRVAVLSGGRSSEHDVSLRSGASVARGLIDAGHEALPVTIARDGRWSCEGSGVELTPAGGLLGADAAFPALHGPFGEDGSVQGLLEWLDIPYVGSDVLASAVCMDKLTLKRLFAQRGVPQVGFAAAGEEGWRERVAAMGLPLWVKPSRLGSSVGISRVEALGKELDEAVELALRHDPRVIVEASAHGREVECSVLGNDNPETSLPGEIVAHAEWYDFEAKYGEGGMELAVPAPIPPSRRTGSAASPPRSSSSPAARASPAATSSSSPAARFSSTRSTRCRASPRPASTPSSSRQAASPTPISATASSTSRSSVTGAPAPTSSEPAPQRNSSMSLISTS